MNNSTCHGCGVAIEPSRRGRPRKWCSQRCRKSQYDLVCVGCGGRVDGTTPSRMADRENPVCLACAGEYYKTWTAEAIVLAIQEWAAEYGSQPAATDWNAGHAVALGHPEKAARYREGSWPPVSTVQRVFGSWNAAIAAAGFDPRTRGAYDRDNDLDVDEAIRLYVEERLGMGVIARHFGVVTNTIRYHLIKHDVPIRASVDGIRLYHEQMRPEAA